MTEPRDLFTPRPPAPRPSIEERFRLWIATYPDVVDLMRRLALEALGRGKKRIGIAALFEVARWEIDIHAPESGVKLNNDFRALMSRHLAEIEPRLKDVFETRERRTA